MDHPNTELVWYSSPNCILNHLTTFEVNIFSIKENPKQNSWHILWIWLKLWHLFKQIYPSKLQRWTICESKKFRKYKQNTSAFPLWLVLKWDLNGTSGCCDVSFNGRRVITSGEFLFLGFAASDLVTNLKVFKFEGNKKWFEFCGLIRHGLPSSI